MRSARRRRRRGSIAAILILLRPYSAVQSRGSLSLAQEEIERERKHSCITFYIYIFIYIYIYIYSHICIYTWAERGQRLLRGRPAREGNCHARAASGIPSDYFVMCAHSLRDGGIKWKETRAIRRIARADGGAFLPYLGLSVTRVIL